MIALERLGSIPASRLLERHAAAPHTNALAVYRRRLAQLAPTAERDLTTFTSRAGVLEPRCENATRRMRARRAATRGLDHPNAKRATAPSRSRSPARTRCECWQRSCRVSRWRAGR